MRYKSFFGDKGLVKEMDLNDNEREQLYLSLENDDKTIKHESYLTEMLKKIFYKIKTYKNTLVEQNAYEKAAIARDLEKILENKIITNTKTFKESLQTMMDFKSNLIFGNYGFDKCLEVDKMIVDNAKEHINIVIDELHSKCFLIHMLPNLITRLNDGVKINIVILNYNDYFVSQFTTQLKDLSKLTHYENLKEENLKILHHKEHNDFRFDNNVVKSDLFFITADNDKYRLDMNDDDNIDKLHFMACFNGKKSETIIKLNKYFDYLLSYCNDVII